ncbi:MAG: nickel pincer cofactor biosynthesis protein LarB [Planctomycetota bacterium]|nr:nickel pincer cofactor biosynthesis protein LarB [Planctomycetota bacterium]
MDRTRLEQLLADVQQGVVDPAAAADRLERVLPRGAAATPEGNGRETPVVHLDHHRELRCGFPEVVLGSSKTTADLLAIAGQVLERHDTLLVTRAVPEQAEALQAAHADAEWHERARAITILRGERPPVRTGVLIVTAGTGDVPVAEEARITAATMGHEASVAYDVGVAGLHRILGEVEQLRRARVVVVCAGMDGALPSVVGGLVGVPVIAVPTSVGYGMQLEGVAPLLTMLNACAPNVCVVNVDNGFGAGYLAALINQTDGEAPVRAL